MVKYTDLLIGVVIFAGFLGFAFFATGTLGQDYNSRDFQSYLDLQENYTGYSDVGTSNKSLIREQNIITKVAQIASDAGAALLNGGVQAVKFIPDTFGLIGRVIDRVETDMGIEEIGFITDIIKSIIGIVVIIIVMTMFMRTKAET